MYSSPPLPNSVLLVEDAEASGGRLVSRIKSEFGDGLRIDWAKSIEGAKHLLSRAPTGGYRTTILDYMLPVKDRGTPIGGREVGDYILQHPGCSQSLIQYTSYPKESDVQEIERIWAQRSQRYKLVDKGLSTSTTLIIDFLRSELSTIHEPVPPEATAARVLITARAVTATPSLLARLTDEVGSYYITEIEEVSDFATGLALAKKSADSCVLLGTANDFANSQTSYEKLLNETPTSARPRMVICLCQSDHKALAGEFNRMHAASRVCGHAVQLPADSIAPVAALILKDLSDELILTPIRSLRFREAIGLEPRAMVRGGGDEAPFDMEGLQRVILRAWPVLDPEVQAEVRRWLRLDSDAAGKLVNVGTYDQRDLRAALAKEGYEL